MPGTSVSIADYLAIDIACRHTTIPRNAIADYFGITVNALNARLRTCTDRLRAFPNFVGYCTNILNAILIVRPEFANKVHPIWELSRRMLQSHTDGVLAAGLTGFDENKGPIYDFMATSDFRVAGIIPMSRPEDDMLDLPSGRKKKHEGTRPSPSRNSSPAAPDSSDLPEVMAVTISGAGANAKKRSRNELEGPEEKTKSDTNGPEDLTVEKTQGRGSRSEPYSQHELCCIYIARRIRMLDWDTISWSLSRFRTPTVAMLAEARTMFDQHHESIVETLRLCYWPEDSMYLIFCVAGECLAAIERGNWTEELKQFKNNRGHLHQLYWQRRIERLYRKSTETVDEKKTRRRWERRFGYEWLSIEDFGRIPLRKRVGAMASAESNKPRKRRTREEIQELAAERAVARALLKANGLKANGQAKYERKKVAVEKAPKVENTQQAAAVSNSADLNRKVSVKSPSGSAEPEISSNPPENKRQSGKGKKRTRRKYDIPEIDRIAFSGEEQEAAKRENNVPPAADHGITNESRNAVFARASNEKINKYNDWADATTYTPRQEFDHYEGAKRASTIDPQGKEPWKQHSRSSSQSKRSTYTDPWRDRDILNGTNKSPIHNYGLSNSNWTDHRASDFLLHKSPESIKYHEGKVSKSSNSPSQSPAIQNLLSGNHHTTQPAANRFSGSQIASQPSESTPIFNSLSGPIYTSNNFNNDLRTSVFHSTYPYYHSGKDSQHVNEQIPDNQLPPTSAPPPPTNRQSMSLSSLLN